MMIQLQNGCYGGRAWANEIAKRGYAVLVHDCFTFGSRRVRYNDTLDIVTSGLKDKHPESAKEISAYNEWAKYHESVMAKALFCAGTTWPAVSLNDDQRALDVLCARSDVDEKRVACGGLSGGGLRTVYLAGLDHRIKAAVCVGFMSTWNDFLLEKCAGHTWMTYTPGLSNYLEFPEIIGLRAPLPTMVLNCTEDHHYSVSEVKKAFRILREVYQKAGAPGNIQCVFYPGHHKFDEEMQDYAFKWLERMLK